MVNIYLGTGPLGTPAFLSFYEGWFPSLLIIGPPGSWKSLSTARTLIENLLAEDWTCIYICITPDFSGIQYGNSNPMDLETLKYFHSEFFWKECEWRTYGIPEKRIHLLVSPFWRGSLKELEKEYGLEAKRWRIPVWSVMLEALQDFWGGGEDTVYFKDLREVWEDVRAQRSNKEVFITRLQEKSGSLPAISQEWGQKFVNKIKQWFEMEDPILTDQNDLYELLKLKGHLLILYFPQEEITVLESATFATFIYTIIETCGRLRRQYGNKYCVIIEDTAWWTSHPRSVKALEALIQRKGRKSNMFRVLIAQTDDDLTGTLKETSKDPVFDFRIETTINPVEVEGELCRRGAGMFLYLRKQTFTRRGPKKYRRILFVSRPPLTSYQLFKEAKK